MPYDHADGIEAPHRLVYVMTPIEENLWALLLAIDEQLAAVYEDGSPFRRRSA